MVDSQTVTREEARERLLLSYKEGNPGGFLEFLKRPFLNPIEQHDDRNKRRVHPMLIVTGVLLLLAAAALVFFSIH
jgi:hypothetical protein